jgi:predicted MFS family arabinose efflux permease
VKTRAESAALILSLGLAGFVVMAEMFAHSTLLTVATEFAAKARGTAMSLVAFCMMGGGAVGTALGGRIVEASSFIAFFGLWAILLIGLTFAGYAALSPTMAETQPETAP